MDIVQHYAENKLRWFWPKAGSLVVSDAGCQIRSYNFEPQLGQYNFRYLTQVNYSRLSFIFHQLADNHCDRRLTEVTMTNVILLPPMG